MAKRPRVQSDADALTSNPFAALAGQGEGLSDGPAIEDTADAPPEEASASVQGRVIVRRQRKGQGGKTVTVVEGLEAAAADATLGALRKQLGCSARRAEEVVLVGTSDHARVARWLEENVGARVTVGN